MLKLNASYSKKVPAETEFSSKSFHASLEVELSDAITPEGIKAKIHETFELVRSSVESEINSVPAQQRQAPPVNNQAPAQSRPFRGNPANSDAPASDKQFKLLFDLGNRAGVRINDLVRERFNVGGYGQLSKGQCSQLIDELVRLSDKAA